MCLYFVGNMYQKTMARNRCIESITLECVMNPSKKVKPN